jgi:hypothetical protein
VVGSGDELCGPLSALFQAVAYHLRTVGHLLFQPLFTESLCGDQLFASSPFSSAQSTLSSLLHVLFSSLFIIQGFFVSVFVFCRSGVSLSRGLCWFIPGVAVVILHATYFLTCWSVSPKQVWSWHLVAQEPSCFLSVTWHVEALYWLGVQWCQNPVSSWWFFSANCDSSISARFLIYRVPTVCFLPLVTILDPPCPSLLKKTFLFD